MKPICALGVAFLGVVVVAACSGNTKQNDNSTAPTIIVPQWTPPVATPTATGTATPVPTPSTPVYLESFYTPAGTNQIPMGECLGFTVRANDGLGTVIDPAATVKVGNLSGFEATWEDGKHLSVGNAATGGKCTFLPIFGTVGPVDVTVTSGPNTWTLPSAIEITPAKILDAGFVGQTQVFTRDYMSSNGANTFERPFDVDIYKVTSTDLFRVYPEMDFFDLSTKNLVPRLEFWNKHWPNDVLGKGAFAVTFPESGVNYFVVRDVQGRGGPGADYDLGIVSDELGWVPDGSGCALAQPITPGGYHIDDIALTNVFDPLGSSHCADSTFGTPIFAPGPDAMFTITVPAGKTLRASAYDNHWSQAIYLLPRTGASCDPRPTNCTRAAGYFGGGDTNLLEYPNTSGADEDFYLVFDTTAVKGTSDGAFLINVQLLDRK